MVDPVAVVDEVEEQRKRVRRYVVARLRREVRGTHGAQARLAREFRMTSAHLSNVLSDNPTREPGHDFLHRAAKHWGMTYGELETLVLSEAHAPLESSTSLSAATGDDEAVHDGTGTDGDSG